MTSTAEATELPLSLSDVTVGVVTALPHEYLAAHKVLGCTYEVAGSGKTPAVYRLGQVPTRTGGQHVVAVTVLPHAGNNQAGNRVVQMQQDCDNLQLVLMCGIALGMPRPDSADKHVRLGDLVVCDEGGVVDYQRVKQHPDQVEPRHLPRAPSEATLEATARLEAASLEGERPWEDLIELFEAKLGPKWHRPNSDEDVLQERLDSPPIPHPHDPTRREGKPRLFKGKIASGNTLVASAEMRDSIRDQFDVRALEMEASGIADAAHRYRLDYQVVRGVCDYGNQLKGDRWQKYAALIAACFTACLLREVPAIPARPPLPSSELAVSVYSAQLSEPVGPIEVRTPPPEAPGVGDRLAASLKKELASLNYDRAEAVARDLRAFIDSSEGRFPGEKVAGWLEQLIAEEAQRARRQAGPGEQPDLRKAREYLREAKDVIEGR